MFKNNMEDFFKVEEPELTNQEPEEEEQTEGEPEELEEPEKEVDTSGEEIGKEEEDEPLAGQSKEANAAFRKMRNELKELKERNAAFEARELERQQKEQEEVRQQEVKRANTKLEELNQKLKTLPQQIYEQALRENIHESLARTMASNAQLNLQVQIMEERERVRLEQQEQYRIAIEQEHAILVLAEQIDKDHKRLVDKYGDIVPEVDKMDAATINKMRAGSSLYDAFVAAHEDELFMRKTKEAKRQAEIVAGSKEHLKPDRSGGGKTVKRVPQDVVALYRKFVDATEDEIYDMWMEDQENKKRKK